MTHPTTTTATADLPKFDKAELTRLYEKFFNDSESPEEMLSMMMLEITDIEGGPNQKHLKSYNYDFLVLMGFFDELFKPVRTPSMRPA